jgi:hypothetical protein
MSTMGKHTGGVKLKWCCAGSVPDADAEKVCTMIVDGQRSFPADVTESTGGTTHYTLDVSTHNKPVAFALCMTSKRSRHVLTPPHAPQLTLKMHASFAVCHREAGSRSTQHLNDAKLTHAVALCS